MQGADWLGWVSSIILCITIARQIYSQYKAGTSRGVSMWLYLGQFTAEIGFIIYSYFVQSWVFLFTNIILLLENVAGLCLVLYQRKKTARSS